MIGHDELPGLPQEGAARPRQPRSRPGKDASASPAAVTVPTSPWRSCMSVARGSMVVVMENGQQRECKQDLFAFGS